MSIPQTPSPLSNIIAAKTYNAAWFSGSTKELQITAAIAAAVTDGALYVYIPASMLPYIATAVTFNTAIKMLREGGDSTGFDVLAYGVRGNNIDDSPSFKAAIAAAGAAGGGTVRMPVGTFNIGATSPGLSVPSNVYLIGEGMQATTLTYSGTGIAIDTYGAQSVVTRDFYVILTNDAGSGIRWGNQSRWCRCERVTVQGTNTLTNTGTGFLLDSGPAFSTSIFFNQVYALANKYGMRVVGQNSLTGNTWAAITGINVFLIGRSAGRIVGSIGLWVDAQSNMEGSTMAGLIVESNDVGIQQDNGTQARGFSSISAGFEANGVDFSFQRGMNGEFYDAHAGGSYYRSSTNQLTNLWDREQILNGVWQSESYYDRVHTQYSGIGNILNYGLRRGGSPILGEFAGDKFIVSTGQDGDVNYFNNWIKLLEYKYARNNAIPALGSYGIGSIVQNIAPTAGMVESWRCTASGTFKAAPGITATTTVGTPTVTVSALGTLERNDYITIAGAFAAPARIKQIVGLVLTLDANAAGTVAGVAVVYPTPTFIVIAWAPGVDSNQGDASPVLTQANTPTIPFSTALSVNRTVTMPAPLYDGQKFRIVRTGLGAGTLTVQDNNSVMLKVMPAATAAWTDIECRWGTSWILTGYGTL